MGKKNIAVCGAFGIGSAGDEAALMFLRQVLPEDQFEITVYMRNPSPQYALRHSVSVQRKLEYDRKPEDMRNLRGFNPNESTKEVANIIDVLDDVDLLLLGPGAFMNDQHDALFHGALQEMYAMSLLADMAGCSYAIWGASVNSMGNPVLRRMLEALIRNAEYTVFRDHLSLERAYAYGARGSMSVLSDPVFGYAPLKEYKKTGGDIAISVRDVSHVIDQRTYETAIVRLIMDILEKGRSVVLTAQFVDGSNQDDSWVIDSIVGQLAIAPNIKGLVRWHWSNEPEELEKVYGSADLVIGTRLHACVLAARAGTPFVPVSYDQKIEGLCDMMGQETKVVSLRAKKFLFERVQHAMSDPVMSSKEELKGRYESLFGSYFPELKED